MATSVTATIGLATIAPVRNASSLSSSASFGSPIVSVAPLRSTARRNVMIARAALPESGVTARREMLASLMAAGAVIATAGQSIAASGPGNSGAKRTNEKAQDLLKAADTLTTDESPPRFGPGRTGGGDSSRIAQQGGSGAVEELQGAGGGAIEGAKTAVAKAKSRIDGIFGKKSTGDLSDASSLFGDAAGKVKSDIGTTQGKVKSDIGTTEGKVKSDIGTVEGKVKSDLGTGGSFVADAQKNLEDAVDSIKSSLPQ